MNDDRRILRASTFDEVAELYDRSRIGPPEQLFDDLFTLAEIAPPADSSVLEVGCGTGQATQQLARRGCRVVCVEMGANLACIARRNLAQFPNVTVMTTRFEDWEPCDERFDIVLAVTSWHWIDPEVRYAKAARVLKPEGVLAFTTAPTSFRPASTRFSSKFSSVTTRSARGTRPDGRLRRRSIFPMRAKRLNGADISKTCGSPATYGPPTLTPINTWT
jgi:SAM-dependent methyltransferase